MTAQPNELDLLYTDVEDSLRETVRDLLGSRCTPDRVVALYDGDRSLVAPLWKALAVDLGLAGLMVPEALGGAGASAREAAVVLEELGRFVAPAPFLTSSVVATAVLLAAEPSPARDELLAGLAAGERSAALVLPFSAGPADPSKAVRGAGSGALEGRVTSVAGASEADVLLVPVPVEGASADGASLVELHAVDASAASIEPVLSLDMTRQLADVDLTGVDLAAAAATGAGSLVVEGTGATSVVRQALVLGAGLLASEQVGLAGWCLDTTVGYLKQRRQFGRVVGGFQALKHRLADLYVQVESARAAARYAAATAALDDPDREVAASVAAAYCSQVAVRAAEECVQLHGGIGMTWEHPAHLYLKRAKADQIALGTPGAHRRLLAGPVDLPAPA